METKAIFKKDEESILKMDEIKIGKAFEEQLDREDQQELKESLEEDYSSPAGDGKKILIAIVLIIGVFAFSFGGFKVYDYFTSANIIDIDDLHNQNMEGNLDEEEGYMYNGYSFLKVDGLWWTEVLLGHRLIKIPLHFGPKEVEEIEITGTLDPSFNQGNTVYVALDPKVQNKYYTLALSELIFNVAKGLDRNPEGSCTEENWVCEDRTIVSCENNPENKPVIELALDEEASIELSGTCIKVSGNEYEIVKSVNRLLYQWYDVMEN